jgi:predicted transcriptional regulator
MIAGMSEPKSIFDIPPDEEFEARLEAEAIAELEAGKGVPHERVREWLERRIRGEKVPPPID